MSSSSAANVMAASIAAATAAPQNNASALAKPAIACPVGDCGGMFTNVNKLVVHIETEHKDDPNRTRYKCADCGFRAVLAWSLQKHIYRVHTHDALKMKEKMGIAGAAMSKCALSQYVDEMDRKEADNPSSSMAECPHCTRTFIASSQLRTHVENVHRPGSTSWGCIDCGYAFTTVHFLKVHIEGAHTRDPQAVQHKLDARKEIIAPGTSEPPSLECDVCGKKYSTTESLKGHKRQTHRPKSQYFKCDIGSCEQSHKRNAHKPGAPTIPCEQCGAIFASSQALSIHIRSRHEEDSLVRRKDTDPRNRKGGGSCITGGWRPDGGVGVQQTPGGSAERKKRPARPAASQVNKQDPLSMTPNGAGLNQPHPTLTPLSNASSPMLQVHSQQNQPANVLLQQHNLMGNTSAAHQLIQGQLQAINVNAQTIGIGDLYHSISRAASSYAWMDNMGQINPRQGRLIAIFICPQCHKQFSDVNELLQHQVVEHALC